MRIHACRATPAASAIAIGEFGASRDSHCGPNYTPLVAWAISFRVVTRTVVCIPQVFVRSDEFRRVSEDSLATPMFGRMASAVDHVILDMCRDTPAASRVIALTSKDPHAVELIPTPGAVLLCAVGHND